MTKSGTRLSDFHFHVSCLESIDLGFTPKLLTFKTLTFHVTLSYLTFWLSAFFICEMEIPQLISKNFPGDSDGKESACNAGDLGLSRVEKIPWGREWMPTPVFLPEEFHGQRSLQSMGPQRVGHK